MDIWINLISDLGFPVAITLFVLLRLEKSIQVLTEEIRKLSSEKQKNSEK